MSAAKSAFVAGGGAIAVLVGFALDRSSTSLATVWYNNNSQTSIDQPHAQAYSHAGIALMVFGFVLATVAIYTWLRAPSEKVA